VDAALAELFRVLKPGGRFEFLEHGLHPDPAVARRQKRWNWLQRLIGDGCRLDLDVEHTVRFQPFQIARLDTWQMEHTPPTHGFLYRGTAVKPSNAIRAPLTD
jgi:SAM-dependent methyltransferase